jgi:broad specificity phosphatase PhoE
MAVDLIYETHSTTTDNEAGIATGWLPGELSGTGRRQARQLGERHHDRGVAAVFSSDLRRAVQTARIAFDGTGIPVYEDARLRECDYGTLNGMPVNQLERQRLQHIDEPFPGGESYRQVVERTRAFLADLVRDFDGQRVVVIAHSANRWALDVLVHGRRLEDAIETRFTWQPGWHYRCSAPG